MSAATATGDANVSLHLARWANEAPGRVAVRGPDGRELSFEALERLCGRLVLGLSRLGLARGDRVCLFVRPGPELIALTHALFRLGALPVLIDPGMGRAALLSCIARMRPRGLVGVPQVHVARLLRPAAFRTVEVAVTVGRRLPWGGPSLAELAATAGEAPAPVPTAADDEAAILFTSGSTGPPKGVVVTHGTFQAQLDALRELYGLEPGEVDAACFPLFALFDNALGMTSVFPPLDPSRPGACDPAAVHRAIEASGATFAFGSPAVWRRIAPWAARAGKRFTGLRRVTCAGAPVAPGLLADLLALLPPGAEVHTPYGATEALPVTSIPASEVLALRERIEGGAGTCVGRAAPGVELRLIPIRDEPLRSLGEPCAPGVPGEICVRGAVVTREYRFDPEATRAAKIEEGGALWHRMGDVGTLDAEGRLWYLGRKAHRLETERGLLMPVPLENVYDTCAGVARSALVGVGPRGSERPHLIVEPAPGARRAELVRRLRQHGARHPGLPEVEGVLFHRAFPVDVRHNAKIHRGQLKRWAERRLS